MSTTETLVAPLPLPTLNQEIIDVDALEDDMGDAPIFTGYHRHSHEGSSSRISHMLAEEGVAFMGFRASSLRPRRPVGGAHPRSAMSEDVIVLESDDEAAPSSSSNTGRRPIRTRIRLFSPPPPQPQRGYTPVVPPLPPHLVSQSSLRRRTPRENAPDPGLPPVVRPNADPLPFENNMAGPLPRLPPRSTSTIAAAPQSHYHPVMGLGGMALALNRQAAQEDHEADAPRNTYLPSFSEIIRRVTNGTRASEAPEGMNSGGVWQRWWPWITDGEPREDLIRDPPPFEDDMFFVLPPPRYYKHQIETPVHWKPEYTHPDKAGPGFSYDFAPADTRLSPGAPSSSVITLDDDEAGPSAGSSSATTAVETTLVCARCLDPLVLAAPAGAPEEARKKYRVWALRCGHMLDGKCIEELCAPLPPPRPPSPVQDSGNNPKGKGKARADPDVEVDGATHVEEFAAASVNTLNAEGKRTAVEPPTPEPPSKRPAIAGPLAMTEGNPIRSRLRSHTRLVDPPSAEPSSSAAVPPELRWRPLRRGRTGPGRGRGKGKGRAKAELERTPVIEAEHQWMCPVAGCRRVHYGVCVQGEWKNDEGRGGIALFI